MSRLSVLLTAALFAFTLSAGAQEPPKPPKPPKPGQVEEPKLPLKRSYFCTGKSDGWYCGENDEPRLFKCGDGHIQTSMSCSAGCDADRNRCKQAEKPQG